MRRIIYVIKKISQRIRQALLMESSNFIKVRRRRNCNQPKTIGFYLDEPLFIHLGDQLLLEPAIRFVQNTFEAYVWPTPAMAEYFIKAGMQTINSERFFECDLLVTRDELLSYVSSKTNADIISINPLAENMQHRYSEAIVHSLADYFKISIPDNFDFSPWKPETAHHNLLTSKVVLSPYVDSGWFRVRGSDIDQLSFRAKQYADQFGFKLCLVGGKDDARAKTPAGIKPSFEDWRGLYSPCQFMQILSSGQIAMVFTFDTFVFHAAASCGVPVTVKIRRRVPKKTLFIEEHFLPAYSSPNHQINFL